LHKKFIRGDENLNSTDINGHDEDDAGPEDLVTLNSLALNSLILTSIMPPKKLPAHSELKFKTKSFMSPLKYG